MREPPEWARDLPEHQKNRLAEVYDAVMAAIHHRAVLKNEMGRAVYGGCTVEQLAEVTGLTADGVR